MEIKSWFNETRKRVVTEGVMIGDKNHKLSPVAEGKVYKAKPCPACCKNTAFVFRSHTNGKMYVAICKSCGTETPRLVQDETAAPVPGTTCKCGAILPPGRKLFCFTCRPQKSQGSSKSKVKNSNGEQLPLGAEIGISTSKLNAFGTI